MESHVRLVRAVGVVLDRRRSFRREPFVLDVGAHGEAAGLVMLQRLAIVGLLDVGQP